MLARLLRLRQHSGQSLSFCGEAHFEKDVEEIVSEQTKLACTTGFLKANLQPLASLAWVCRLASHWVTVDGPITMLKWTWHCRRPQNRTENFVRFEAGRTEHSDGFSERCAIIFRLSHPAAARFRRSFRNSVCKTSLFLSKFYNPGEQIKTIARWKMLHASNSCPWFFCSWGKM